MKQHIYNTELHWTGNTGQGTNSYTAYERSYEIKVQSKPVLYGSSDPSFRGDRSKYNPEELFLMSISACHMLWYLHLCSEAKITVIKYSDQALATMTENKDGSGRFDSAQLNPNVEILEKDKVDLANELHEKANQMCFIANSCNFDISHSPKTCSTK